MKLIELFEAQQNKLILVDFQPAYEHASGYYKTFNNVINHINTHPNIKVLAFFNGQYSGEEDTKQDVIYHYIENDLNEEYIDNIEFIEKSYGFLRNWMDIGIDSSVIIKTLRYMKLHHIQDSREIEEEELVNLLGTDYDSDLINDSIYFNDIKLNQLKQYSNALMGGGGRHECFREMQILMSAFNIRNKEVQQWIY